MIPLLAIIFNSHILVFKNLILKRRELFDLLFTVHKMSNSIIVAMEKNLPLCACVCIVSNEL